MHEVVCSSNKHLLSAFYISSTEAITEKNEVYFLTSRKEKPTGKLMISYKVKINIKCSEHTGEATKYYLE